MEISDVDSNERLSGLYNVNDEQDASNGVKKLPQKLVKFQELFLHKAVMLFLNF